MNAPVTEVSQPQVGRLTTPSRFELTVLYFLLGAHVILATDAAIPSGWVMFASTSFAAVALWFAIRVGIAAWRFRTTPPHKLRWLEAGLITAVLVVIHATPIGIAARVYLSERHLMDHVRLSQGLPGTRGAIPCGLFTIHRTTPGEDRVLWLETVSGSRLFESYPSMWGGVVYCEQGPPPPFGEIRYRHLYGPWWTWLQDI